MRGGGAARPLTATRRRRRRVVAVACSAVSTMCLTADGELVMLSSQQPPDTSVTTEFAAVHTIHTADPVVALFGGGYYFSAVEAHWDSAARPKNPNQVRSLRPSPPTACSWSGQF